MRGEGEREGGGHQVWLLLVCVLPTADLALNQACALTWN